MPLCVCYGCGAKMDCNPSGKCDLCEMEVASMPIVEISPRETLIVLQRLHQIVLREDDPYVGPEQGCRWVYSGGIYSCEHVRIPEADVLARFETGY